MAFITSHLEVAERDITINGRAVGKGQAYIVSDLEFTGGSGGAGGVDYVKIASFIGEEILCFKMNEVFQSLSGSDMVTTAGSTEVTSAATEWEAQGVTEGDYIKLTNGSDAGPYKIATVGPGGDANALELECAMATDATLITFEIVKDAAWEPDYATVFTAYPEPGSPLWRYRPYLGPGDHTGCNLITLSAISDVFAPGHNFGDEPAPVPVGAYLEIYQGADAGRYRITAVKGNTLTLASAMTAGSPAGGLAYRISLVSEFSPTLTMVTFDNKRVLVGLSDDFNVKIVKAIRTINQATSLDSQRIVDEEAHEGSTEAKDLFSHHGPYLACYRLENETFPIDPMIEFNYPVSDRRAIIMVRPWRGYTKGTEYVADQFDVRGQLFFNQGDLPIWENLDFNPVMLIGWIANQYRLKFAIAIRMVYEPPVGGLCQDNP